MKRQIVVYGLTILALLTLVAGCGGNAAIEPPADTAPRINPPIEMPTVLDAWPTLDGRHPDAPQDYDLIAESEHLRLYLEAASSALIVEDKRNGKLWRSSPTDLDEVQVSQAWRQRIKSPILLRYTDADRGQAKVSKPEDAVLNLTPVEGGARVTYSFPGEGFELDVFYVVRDDLLEVTIPGDGIVEGSEENTLISLDVLSFLGATRDGEQGYIAFPDGSGAVMGYTSSHPEAVQEISTSIYGEEKFIPGDAGGVYHEPAAIPVFGLVGENDDGSMAGFGAIISQGDFDAKLSVGRSGKRIPYNHTWAQFIYRRQGEFSLTGGQPAWLYEPDRIGGDRQVRFYFLTEESANYAGIATCYRDFLIRERGAQQIGGDAPLMRLGFFLGIERRTWFLRDMVKMTTFDQTRAILDDLDDTGVSRLDVFLWNWNQAGVRGRYPQRVPVEERLGGADDLRALAESTSERGQRLFLYDDYLFSQPGGQGIFPYSDAVRGVDGLPVGEGGFSLINPQVSLREFAVHDVPQMAELGASGLWLDSFAFWTIPDTNDRYPLSREGFAATWMQIADLAREQFGAVAMAGGNSYAILHSDALDFVATDSTHYNLFDETVPLYQIVAPGLVSYAGLPYNLNSDGRRTFLRHIEYGAIPAFVLTEASSSLLYRTEANGLYSTQYKFWRDEVVSQYQAMEELAPLVNQFIVAHARLAEGVYQTDYEDGTCVVVNYNEQPYELETGDSVPALDFVVADCDNS